MKAEVTYCQDAERLALEVANQWWEELSRSVDRKTLSIALSGGRIARLFYGALADLASGRRELLANAQFFWADERCVPPDHAESNYLLARDNLLRPLDIAPDRIHRIQGEKEPDWAATQAESELCRMVPLNGEGVPLLDYAFLGMGEDGHIASLFPEASPEVVACPRAYCPVQASKPPPRRITLTYRALEAAKQAWVLISGAGKTSALKASLSSEGRTPLGRLMAKRAHTRIFTDLHQANNKS
jgi:6-phosphogluconolactonase